jgi:hypothetical protein
VQQEFRFAQTFVGVHGETAGHERRTCSARIHGRDRDAAAVQLRAERLGQRPRRVLRRRVRRFCRQREQREVAQHVADRRAFAARSRLAQRRQERAADVQRAPEVHVHRATELCDRKLLDRAGRRDAGVVDDEMYAAVRREDLGREANDGVLVADIAAVRAGAGQRLLRGIEAFAIDVYERRHERSCVQRLRERKADAAGRSCDHRNSSCFKPRHSKSLPSARFERRPPRSRFRFESLCR